MPNNIAYACRFFGTFGAPWKFPGPVNASRTLARRLGGTQKLWTVEHLKESMAAGARVESRHACMHYRSCCIFIFVVNRRLNRVTPIILRAKVAAWLPDSARHKLQQRKTIKKLRFRSSTFLSKLSTRFSDVLRCDLSIRRHGMKARRPTKWQLGRTTQLGTRVGSSGTTDTRTT